MGNISTNGTVTGKKFIGPVTGKNTIAIDGSNYIIKGIACCLAPTDTTGSPNSWSSGKLVLHRANGFYQAPTIEYTMHQQYGKYHGVRVSYFTTGNAFHTLYPAVFSYNGTYYGGFIYLISDATDHNISIDTTGNFEPFHIGGIYNTTTGAIINSEVYNSIDTGSVIALHNYLNMPGTIMTNCLAANSDNSMVGTSLPTAVYENQIFFKIL